MWLCEPTTVASPSPVALWIGDVFAEGVVVADLRAGDAALPFQILRLQPDAGEGKNFVLLAQPRVAVNDDVRMQLAARAQRDVLADDAIRPDLAVRADPAPWDE